MKQKNRHLGSVKAPGLNDRNSVNINSILTELRSFNRGSFDASPKGDFFTSLGLFMRSFLFSLFIFASSFASANMITVNDADFYYEVRGRGIPIVLVHGGPGLDHSYLRPQLDDLAIRNKLIYYDQRASGFSSDEGGDKMLSVSQFVHDLEALRIALGYDRIILLGHSWGALLSMHYAILHPENVAALILLSPTPPSHDGMQEFVKEYTRRSAPHKEILDRIAQSKPYLEGSPKTVESYWRLVFGIYSYDPGNAKNITLDFTPDSARKLLHTNNKIGNEIFNQPWNIEPQLAKVSAPTLIIHGQADPIPYQEAMKIQKAIPNAQFVEIFQAGHFTFVEKKEETLAAITNFLVNLELAGRRD